MQTGVVDEFHPVPSSAVVDETNTDVPSKGKNETPAISRMKVIGPRNPTIIFSYLNTNNILLYSRRSNALVTTASEAPCSFREAQNSVNKSIWTNSIKEEHLAMET
ncbi:hypothetical protein O181_051536 [Austropuccinia psidii MF-1]|uniref:Uncharacterized protein n=1 Tax=Austropuccinia psidii MF-1 TaxID=1389203 RepID=A0A9Q3E3X5_9BASI|nr:hypothetical protein [Austropuccinia psidii MF-1]